jgi:hypothetical protein
MDGGEDDGRSYLRENLLSSSFFASSVVLTLLKLIYKLRSNQKVYNLHASHTLMILIGLLKFYNAEEAKTDPELINKITLGIKFLTNPKIFLDKKIAWLEKETSNTVVKENKRALIINNKKNPSDLLQQKETHLAKQPDD